MRLVDITYLILFRLLITSGIAAQELKVTGFNKSPRDISARENAVYDANGDACAILKLRTGLQNLKFSSDLEIKKIETHSGEYWLWVSANTKVLTIEADSIGKLQYTLPAYAEEYNVYVVFLTVILPDQIVYKNINSVRIASHPTKSEVYIDDIFLGYTPLVINTPSDTFKYEIRKRKYLRVTDKFRYREDYEDLFVPLKKDHNENWPFFTLYFTMGNKYGNSFLGFETGMLGRTGWYISLAPPVNAKKYIATVYGSDLPILVIDAERFSSQVGESPEEYYVKLKEKNNSFSNQFRIKFGITQKIFTNFFIKGGIGLATVTQWYRLNVIPYSNFPEKEIPLKETYFGKDGDSVGMFVLETGLTYRILNSFIISLNISTTGFAHYFNDEDVNYFLPVEGSFGIGFNFN